MNTRIANILTAVNAVLCLISLGTLAACAAFSLARPSTVIQSPPSNSEYHEGEQVAIQSVSTDANGIVRVELSVDGTAVRTDTPPESQKEFSVIQTWLAIPGSNVISVRAFNQNSQGSDPADITINVLPTANGSETNISSEPASMPTLTPEPSATPTGLPVACNNNARFVLDVTVPDGTRLEPGQDYSKIWRLINTGTCAWGNGYTFVFVGDELMGSVRQIPVPATASNATADLLVPMKAPQTPGAHKGLWRLRAPNGAYFGEEVDVVIDVISPAPAAPTACNGTPGIASFSASSTTISQGQSVTLNWGAVTNAQSVVIDNGIGTIVTPGSIVVTPTTTTTYTLTAACGSITATAQVTVNVNSACSGTSSIASFTASPTTIQPGDSATLSWGLVGNADDAEIDNGIGGVMTPGSISVTPGSTTTYTLTGSCGSNSVTAQVTIDVVAATATSTAILQAATYTPTPTITHTPLPTVTHTPTRTMTHTPVPPTVTRTPTSTPTSAKLAPLTGGTPTPTLAH